MTDWSDEVQARLKYALGRRLVGKWVEVLPDDIHSALEEIERLREPCLPTCIPPGIHDIHCSRAYLSRAEAAEARVAAFEAGQKPLEGDSRSRILRRLGVADADEAIDKIEKLEARGERLESLIACPDCKEFRLAADAAHKEAAAQWQDESRLRRAAEAKLVEAQAQLLHYGLLKAAVNDSGECTDDEHGPDCACNASVMLENRQAEVERLKGLLTKVMGRVRHRSPQLAREIIGSVSEDAEFRAALRGGGEHSKHPTGDYCVYCRAQWPCEESGGQ